MKNILWAVVFTLAFLPQVSFAAPDPQWTAFLNQQASDAKAYFQQQAADRATFGQAHADIIAKQDHYGHRLKAWKDAQNNRGTWNGATPQSELTAGDENTLAQFTSQQRGGSQGFFAKQASDRQNFLATHPGISTS